MQPNYNHNQGPINFFPPLEANYHITRGVCLLNSNPPFFLFFFFFCVWAQQIQQTTKDFKTNKKTKKKCSVWKCEADGIIYFCSSSVFITGAQFETHDAPAITVTAYYNAPWHYKCLSLQQCFTAICVYAYLTVQLSLVSKGRLKLAFHFRYCGTIKDSMFKKKKKKRSLCSQNGLLSPVRFIGLGVWVIFCCWFFWPLTPFLKGSWRFSSLYLHRNVAHFEVVCFLFFFNF